MGSLKWQANRELYGMVFRVAEGFCCGWKPDKSPPAIKLTRAIKLTPAMLTVPSQQCGMSQKAGLKSPR
jgi:hypothetical protein